MTDTAQSARPRPPSSPRAQAEQALIRASRSFAEENVATSWWHVLSTLGALTIAVTLAGAAPWWPLRVVGVVLEALVLVRTFILFHDYMHGSLLRKSRPAKWLFHTLGVLMLTPPRVWANTHNFHHANTGRLAARPDGTFALWTVEKWKSATRKERLAYVIERHPLTMATGLLTVFLGSLCLLPFLENPKKNASAGIAFAVHLGLHAALLAIFGVGVWLTTLLLPMVIAYAFGTYLFFVQHNFEEALLREEADWTHAAAAVEASSFLSLSPVMHWFTGNIGYHHVHHLNPRIPFYRLPEAMAAIPELREARTATLRPRDVWHTLTRLDLWDPTSRRFVSFSAAGG